MPLLLFMIVFCCLFGVLNDDDDDDNFYLHIYLLKKYIYDDNEQVDILNETARKPHL